MENERLMVGHDCDGKPLRVGDPVEFVGGPKAKQDRIGERGHVTGAVHDPIVLLLYLTSGLEGPIVRYSVGYDHHISTASALKRLDGVGSWDVVESETGWTPAEVEGESCD